MQTRSEKITENMKLVHALAHRFYHRGMEYDDLVSAGCIGLIKAVDGFDESLGFAFSTYAVPSILGEMKRLFRDDGMVKVSRSLKEKAMYAKNVQEELEKKTGREITLSELSTALDCTPFETAELLNVLRPVRSLTQMLEGEENKERDIPSDCDTDMVHHLELKLAMEKLESFEKNLLQLRYFKGLTQAQTAEILGISQVQVSRKERQILEKIRKNMIESG